VTVDRDELLWHYAESRDQRLFEQLATSLIGIGALFFAYGVVPDPIVRTLIALVGLGGSLALLLHSYAVTKDRDGAFAELSKSPEGRKLLKRSRRAGEWRDADRVRRLYVSSAALAKWLMGWVAIAWLIVIVWNDLSAAAILSTGQTTWLSHYSPTILTIGGALAAFVTYTLLRRSAPRADQKRHMSAEWPDPDEVRP
jgi:hypothetical protein